MGKPRCFFNDIDVCQGTPRDTTYLDIVGRERTDRLCEVHAKRELEATAVYEERRRHLHELREAVALVPDRSVGGRESVAIWKSHPADCECPHCVYTNENLDSWEI